jgi:SAM-dependent methyltransferase
MSSHTDSAFWNEYWDSVRLPLEVQKSSGLLIRAITDVFDRFLGGVQRQSVLEVGGAPGQYAAYVHRRLGHTVTVFDNSRVGCDKARENFDLLGIPGKVVFGDMFTPPPELSRSEVVYSLGLIEHFQDIVGAVRAHTSLVEPGGLLILGVPNLRGLNGLLMGRLAPSLLDKHELSAMDESAWDAFEEALGLERLYRAHIGGFEARTFWRCESHTVRDRLLHRVLWHAGKTLDRKNLRVFRRPNSRYWSAYLIGVYRVPMHMQPERAWASV